MRQISIKCAEFLRGIGNHRKNVVNLSDNTSGVRTDTETILYLWDNEIMRYNSSTHELTFSLSGYNTHTTKSRINEILYRLYDKLVLPSVFAVHSKNWKIVVTKDRMNKIVTDDYDRTFVIKNVIDINRMNYNAMLEVDAQDDEPQEQPSEEPKPAPIPDLTFSQLGGVM